MTAITQATEAADGQSQLTEVLATCEWICHDDDGTWWTSCGEGFVLESGGPTDNGMNYCPYCGNPLVEVANDGVTSAPHNEPNEG